MHQRGILCILLGCPWLIFAQQIASIPLDQHSKWHLSNVHGFNNVSITDIALPTYVIEALCDAGVVPSPDPLYRFNERDYSWVSRDTWTFTTSWNFSNKGNSSTNASIFLIFNAVDTVADISLNGQLLGSIANAHRRHIFDVSTLLNSINATDNNTTNNNTTNNSLEVTIYPPANYSDHQAAVSPDVVPYSKQLGSVGHYNFIRKPASDFGWDWGPAYAPSGILGPVLLVSANDHHPILLDVALRQRHVNNNKSIVITADAYFLTSKYKHHHSHHSHLKLDIYHYCREGTMMTGCKRRNASAGPLWSSDAKHQKEESPVSMSCTDMNQQASSSSSFMTDALYACSLTSASVSTIIHPPYDLWHPWEFGTPALYTATITYFHSTHATKSTTTSNTTDTTTSNLIVSSQQSVNKTLGLRTIKLIRRQLPPVDNSTASSGESFQFEVNGRPLYVRGANIVPMNVFETRVTKTYIEKTVRYAREANMNMLRVWGGGRYLSDHFYNTCDEMGILVWQEFLFACSLYPVGPPLYEEYIEEARQQIIRVNSHPSVALWGGNNEVEAAFGWFPETLSHPERYMGDYEILFVQILRKELARIDPGAIYVDSSPSNGPKQSSNPTSTALTVSSPYIKRWGDVSDPSMGDVHFYDYTSNMLIPSVYPPAKFISEFGFMSLPSFHSYAGQSEWDYGDWEPDNELINFRMRHADGFTQLERQFKFHFYDDRPSSLSFRSYIYLTQLQQALIYETAISQWRRWKKNSVANTQGILYWQLNDVWAGPSWSSINYDGRWKALHNAVKRLYTPLAVFGVATTIENSAKKKERHLEAWIVNDYAESEFNGKLSVIAIPFHAVVQDQTFTLARNISITVPPSDALRAWSAPLCIYGTDIQDVDVMHSMFYHFILCPEEETRGKNSRNNSINRLPECTEHYVFMDELKNMDFLSSFKSSKGKVTVWVEVSVGTGKKNTTNVQLFGQGNDDRQGHTRDLSEHHVLAEDTLHVTAVYDITLTAHNGPALYVWLETPIPGEFSDNFVMVMPWKPTIIRFYSSEHNSTSSMKQGVEKFSQVLEVTWAQKEITPLSRPDYYNNDDSKMRLISGSYFAILVAFTYCMVLLFSF